MKTQFARYRPRSRCVSRSEHLQREALEPRQLLDSTAVISELMYQPGPSGGSEWIEIHNQMAVDLELSGWSFTSGIAFTFPNGTILPGDGYMVVAADPAQVRQTYGLLHALGPWTGSLANGGERVELSNNSGRSMSVVDYADDGDWPVGADGSGASLAKLPRPNAASDQSASWRASRRVGGTPGRANHDLLEPALSVRINELPGPSGEPFWLELAHDESTSVSLAGLRIQSSAAPESTRVVPDRLLAPQEYWVVENAAPTDRLQDGDRLFLYSADGGTLLDAVRLRATAQSRWPTVTGEWHVPDQATPGSANQVTVSNDIVINEILYHHRPTLAKAASPDGTGPIGFQENDEEWIELFNRSDRVVDLSGWTLDEAVDFEFPPGTLLRPGDYLVVARDARSLRQVYPELTNILGDFRGSLSNSTDTIRLRDVRGNLADEVQYFHDGRWDERADGSGPSLELVDPWADNRRGELWQASDEGSKSAWQTYSYRGVADRSVPGEPTVWNELALGLLDGAGELLLDDIRVTEDPDGVALSLLPNGSFDSGDAAHWRFLGNHQRSRVIQDGDNWVLHAIADGATEYQGNQIETTFAGNVRLKAGVTYEISFRAKWLSGSRQLNSRLYFNRLPKTTQLMVPERTGTPGRVNSRWQAGSGPTFDALQHAPLVPAPDEPIIVRVQANDPQGIASIVLWYNPRETGWQSVPMSSAGDGFYQANIPGQAKGTVQFYVEATDAAGWTSMFPAAGRDSHALVAVDDRPADQNQTHDFRLIMTPSDQAWLHRPTNSLSNLRIGSTVIYQGVAYYETAVRLKGSFVGRNARRVGFNIDFSEEHKFQGVHTKVSIDRSTHAELGVDEILLKHAANHAGGIPSMYDDLIDFIAPSALHTGKAALRMSGFDDLYLDSQFENGSDGTMYEYEVIRWPTTTVDGNPESLKRAGGLDDPNGYANIDFRDLGDNKEAYRWTNLIVSNRTRDDYDSMIALHRAMSATGEGLQAATDQVLDVDQWMRTSAYQILFGPGDANYTGANIHNFRLYARPDGKMLYMPWDWDSAFQLPATSGLLGTGRHARVVRIPANLRNYYGHMLDLIETTFNSQYMSRWTEHYGQLGGQNFAARLTYIQRRSEFAEGRIRRDVPPIDFSLTTTGPLTVDQPTTLVDGKGWVNVRAIRLAGTSESLPVTWSSSGGPVADQWQVRLPLQIGRHDYTLEAIDYQGRVIGSQTLTAESSAGISPLESFFRLTEIHYNPAGARDAEFLEWTHIGTPGNTPELDLSGVTIQLGAGTPFRFPANTSLTPGQSIVITNDEIRFREAYPTAAESIRGIYSGNLSNAGEAIRLRDAEGVLLLHLEYDDNDPWPQAADGQGPSLHLISPRSVSLAASSLPSAWNAAQPTPGSIDQTKTGDLNEDSQVDASDVDLLFAALRSQDTNPKFDLNADGRLDFGDRDYLIQDVLHTDYGDANLDGLFNSQDLVLIFQADEYEDPILGNSSWSEGDWDGDGDFTSRDLVLAFQHGKYL